MFMQINKEQLEPIISKMITENEAYVNSPKEAKELILELLESFIRKEKARLKKEKK